VRTVSGALVPRWYPLGGADAFIEEVDCPEASDSEMREKTDAIWVGKKFSDFTLKW